MQSSDVVTTVRRLATGMLVAPESVIKLSLETRPTSAVEGASVA